MARADKQDCVGRLLRGYKIYDESVDVVSAFDGLFASDTLAGSVQHFERFPRIPQESGDALTPDFTVVFNDGTGLVGEVSRLALREESLNHLARQTANYEAISELPIGRGRLQEVKHVDVLLVMPVDVAVQAFHRLLDAARDPNHDYNPLRPPCLVHYSLADNKYVFVRHANPANGHLREEDRPLGEDGQRLAIGAWMERGSVNVPDRLFVPAKIRNAFMNDPVDPLYLATHLWQKEFAEAAGDARSGNRVKLDISKTEVARSLRQRYGTVRKPDVSQAMTLLERAGLAERTARNDRWAVAFHELARGRNEDIHVAIARRACSRRRPSELKRIRDAATQPTVRRGPDQRSFFDG